MSRPGYGSAVVAVVAVIASWRAAGADEIVVQGDPLRGTVVTATSDTVVLETR